MNTTTTTTHAPTLTELAQEFDVAVDMMDRHVCEYTQLPPSVHVALKAVARIVHEAKWAIYNGLEDELQPVSADLLRQLADYIDTPTMCRFPADMDDGRDILA